MAATPAYDLVIDHQGGFVLILLGLLIVSGSQLKVEAGELGMYENISAFRGPNHFVFICTDESAIATVNKKGEVKTYAKEGQGPSDLWGPRVLGILDTEIIVLSNRTNIISFDYDLVPDPDKFPNLPRELGNLGPVYGVSLGKNRYQLMGGFLSKYLLTSLELKNNQWAVGYQGIENRLPPHWRDRFPIKMHLRRHHDRLFLSYSAVEEGPYQIKVFPVQEQLKETEDTVMILENEDLDDFGPYPHFVAALVLPNGGLITGNGYVVLFQARPKQAKEGNIYADLYGLQGGFQKRILLENMPIPCINCPEIFMVQEADGREWVMPWEPPFR